MEKNQSVQKSQKQNSSLQATKDSDIVRKVMPLMNLPENHDKAGFIEAINRFKITESELEEAFWMAYADHFVPQSGIEFRHIYKHVDIIRKKQEYQPVGLEALYR